MIEFEEMISVAVTAGVSFSIWQIILLIIAGKALDKMWILLNEL